MFYFLFWYAIPQTLGSQHFAIAYLSNFGDNPSKVIKGLFLSPQKIVGIILERSRLDYLNQLFLPVGYLFIAFPFFLIFAGPDLLINLLSNNPQLHQLYYQYTATVTPFIFISTIYGIAVIRKLKIESFMIIVYLLCCAFYSAISFGPLPGSRDPNLDMFIKQLPDRAYIDTFLHHIPKKLSVAASNDIGAHLSSRRDIYAIPYGLDHADGVVLLLQGTHPQAQNVYKKINKDSYYH